MCFVYFLSVNVNENWTHLAKKTHDRELTSLQYLGYSENCLIVLSQKQFKNIKIMLLINVSF